MATLNPDAGLTILNLPKLFGTDILEFSVCQRLTLTMWCRADLTLPSPCTSAVKHPHGCSRIHGKSWMSVLVSFCCLLLHLQRCLNSGIKQKGLWTFPTNILKIQMICVIWLLNPKGILKTTSISPKRTYELLEEGQYYMLACCCWPKIQYY